MEVREREREGGHRLHQRRCKRSASNARQESAHEPTLSFALFKSSTFTTLISQLTCQFNTPCCLAGTHLQMLSSSCTMS